ncbi:MAG TPA: AI-2E family transporter [Thermoleophilia bacterium]|nr:AI-2E family transporter [Thermoleophilia bacterium]
MWQEQAELDAGGNPGPADEDRADDNRDGKGQRLQGRAHVASRTAVVVAVVGGTALCAYLVWDLRRIVVWVLMAVVLAATIAPAVSWLERRHMPRWLGATLITLGTVLVVAAIVTAVAVPLATQSDQLLGGLPRLAHDMLRPGGPLASVEQRFHVEERLGEITPERVVRLVAGPRSISSMFSQAAAIFSAVFTVVAITIMLLLEGPRAWTGLVGALKERGERVDDMGRRMQRSVGGYMAGNLLISVCATVGSLAAMSILRVPYALPLALAVGLFDLIPLIGASLGAVLCVLVAFSVGWPQALALLAYFIIYQRAENVWLGPVIYAKTVIMSPLVVLLVSLAGGALGGVVGVLLAIPIAGAVQVAIGELLKTGRARRSVGRDSSVDAKRVVNRQTA